MPQNAQYMLSTSVQDPSTLEENPTTIFTTHWKWLNYNKFKENSFRFTLTAQQLGFTLLFLLFPCLTPILIHMPLHDYYGPHQDATLSLQPLEPHLCLVTSMT